MAATLKCYVTILGNLSLLRTTVRNGMVITGFYSSRENVGTGQYCDTGKVINDLLTRVIAFNCLFYST